MQISLFGKNIISLFLNDRCLALAISHARATPIHPLVSWHLEMCHSPRSHSATHLNTHHRRILL
jgi:hypothetical protein